MKNPGYLGIQMKIKVRTYDIDSAGHVSNIVYFRWLEDLRLQLFEEYFSLRSFVEKGYTPVLAASSIEYKRPIKLFDEPIDPHRPDLTRRRKRVQMLIYPLEKTAALEPAKEAPHLPRDSETVSPPDAGTP